jgi:hypothetical protein
MAPHCVRTTRPTRCSTPDVQPETGKRSAGSGDAAERRLTERRRGITRLPCSQIDEEPTLLLSGTAIREARNPTGDPLRSPPEKYRLGRSRLRAHPPRIPSGGHRPAPRRARSSEPAAPARRRHVAQLESEAVYVLRETAAQFERPVLLFGGGKDSITMVHLARKAITRPQCARTFALSHFRTFALSHSSTTHPNAFPCPTPSSSSAAAFRGR